MLSFELSAIDIVLLVAVLILLSLYVTKMREKPQNQLESKTEQQQFPTKPQKTKKEKKKTESPEEQTKTNFECAHHFGYLRNLPRNTPVPEECFGCPQVMQCLFPSD